MKNTCIRMATLISVVLTLSGQARAQIPVIGGLLAGGGLPGLDMLPLDSLAGDALPGLFSAAGAFSAPLAAIPLDTLLGAVSPLLGLGVTALPVGDLASMGLPLLSPLTINALEVPLAFDSVLGGLLGL